MPKSESFFGRIRSTAKALADSAARSLQGAQSGCCGCKCECDQKKGCEGACNCGDRKQKKKADNTAAVAGVVAGINASGCCSGSSCSC